MLHVRGELFVGSRKEDTPFGQELEPEELEANVVVAGERIGAPPAPVYKPKSPQALYVASVRGQIKTLHKCKTWKQAETIAKQQWKELPDDQKKPWQEEKQKLLDAHRQAVRDWKEEVARIHQLREEVAQLKAANAELRGEDDDVSEDSSSESSPGSDAESSDSEDEDEDEDEVMEVVDSTAGDAGGSEAGGVSPAHVAGAPAIPSDDVAAPAEQAITNAPAPTAWKSRVPPRVYGTRSKKTPGPI